MPPPEQWSSQLCAGSHQPAKASDWLVHPLHQAPCAGGLCLILPLPRCHTGRLYGRQHGVSGRHHSMKPWGKEDITHPPPIFAKPQRTGSGVNTQIHTFPSLSWFITLRTFQTWTSQLQTAAVHLGKQAIRYTSVDS